MEKHVVIFLSPLNLCKLTPDATSSLVKPIILDELIKAINAINKGKALGIDGIPPELYAAFWPQLGPLFLEMINYSIIKGSFSDSSNMAVISLLLKSNKLLMDCSFYRPLRLLNTELKVFAKILATRLEQHMTQLIHYDQSGFIKSRQASDNIRHLLRIINASSKSDNRNAILLDAEKAFDRLELSYLWAVLHHMGFPVDFINMIKTLYANPSAVVLTGNMCSSRFPISRARAAPCSHCYSVFHWNP